MRTVRSSSRLLVGGCLPHCMVEYTDPPPGVGLEIPLARPLNLPPRVWAWRPPVDRIVDTRFWKDYLAPTSLRAVKMEIPIN